MNVTENLSDPVEIAIRNFENYPSVQAIKQNISVNQDFYFSNTEVRDRLQETTVANNKNNGAFGNIPTVYWLQKSAWIKACKNQCI